MSSASSVIKSVLLIDLLAVAICREERDIGEAEKAAKVLVDRFPRGRLLDLAATDLMNATGLESFEALRVLAALDSSEPGTA